MPKLAILGGERAVKDEPPKWPYVTDEVIVPAYTWDQSASAILHQNAISVFMDDILKVVLRHGLYVIEDCAQALGAKYKGRYVGTLSHISRMHPLAAVIAKSQLKCLDEWNEEAAPRIEPSMWPPVASMSTTNTRPHTSGSDRLPARLKEGRMSKRRLPCGRGEVRPEAFMKVAEGVDELL